MAGKRERPGHPPHEPTAEQRQLVEMMVALGILQTDIAAVLGIDPKTLRLHYRRELDIGAAKANAVVGGKLFQKCQAGDTAAIIWWTKTRMKWSQAPQQLEVSGPKGGPIRTVDYSNLTDEQLLALDDLLSKLETQDVPAVEETDDG